MVRKRTLAFIIFSIALCYIANPWFFEKKLLFNELLSFTGIFIYFLKGTRSGNDTISIGITWLILLCAFHAITSLFRMDSIYYYLRNMVIMYSIFSFFIGYYLYKHLPGYLARITPFLQAYIIIFLFIPVPAIYERFGVSVLFPTVFKKRATAGTLIFLIFMNIIYGINYDSSTAIIIAGFLFFIACCQGYRLFKYIMLLGAVAFAALFLYLLPNLSLIEGYTPQKYYYIYKVINSHPLLSLDPNSTWRLVFWKQLLIDRFPENLFGLGFGTPAMKYFPVEDMEKIEMLPYVFGAHNSFVYLFARLGILFPLIIFFVYRNIFREYFYHKAYYYGNNSILLFWSFFAITIVALFNPTLESPVFSSAYWLILGLLARTIHIRVYKPTHRDENSIHS